MIDNRISFTSNIKFINCNKFLLQNRQGVRIGFRHNEPNILKASEFYSMDIRTCTGGGVVNPHIEAEGFHLWDDLTNKKNFAVILNRIFSYVKAPERALLIGGKHFKEQSYSFEQYNKLQKAFLERIKNVSFFEEHRHLRSESHYHYSLESDTWTICSKFWIQKGKKVNPYYVKTPEDLFECFEEISIAKGDRLFIGKREILPENYPELFAK